MARKPNLLKEELKNYWLEKGTVMFSEAATEKLGSDDEARVQEVKTKLAMLKKPLEIEGHCIVPIRDGRKTVGFRIIRPGEDGTASEDYIKVVHRTSRMVLGFGRSLARKVENGRNQSLLPPEYQLSLLPGFKSDMQKLIEQL